LTDARLSDINSGNWITEYLFNGNGDMASRTIQSDTGTFTYDGHQMKSAAGDENFTLYYDENGQLIYSSHGPQATSYEYNWDGKLRLATKGGTTIKLKYDPMGNRVWKKVIPPGGPMGASNTNKYIVDIVGDLPVILLELDPNDNMSIEKTYIYANSQILAQHEGKYDQPRYFYLHDRLGSVRLIIDTSAVVKNCYTYKPFGELFATETTENILNPFKFSGQCFDDEIEQYHLRARQYDPYIYRFTSRDPVFGKFEEPLSMHKYLYCINDPINLIDPWGLESKEMNAMLYQTRIIQVAIDWEIETSVEGLAMVADMSAYYRKNDRTAFVEDLLWLFTERRGPNLYTEYADNAYSIYRIYFGQSGFKQIYQNTYTYEEWDTVRNQPNQVRHFVAAVGAGYYYGSAAYPIIWGRDRGDHPDRVSDRLLGYKGVDLGRMIMGYPHSYSKIKLGDVGDWIRGNLAE